MRGTPPGWPKGVPRPVPAPPGADGSTGEGAEPLWIDRAALWLFDHSPAEYREYPLLRRHPLILAWLLTHNNEALTEAARRSYATARAELAPLVSPLVIAQLLAMLERDGARLLARQREADLVWDAMQRQRP